MSVQVPEPGPGDEQAASSPNDGQAASPSGAQVAASPSGAQVAASPSGAQVASSPSGGQAASSPSRPRFFWVPGSVGPGEVPLAGPVPASAFPAAGVVPGAGPARVLDEQALLDALAAGGFMDGREEDQDAVLADELAGLEDGRMGPPLSAGQAAALAIEHMDPGPAMAGWLDAAVREADSLDEYGLTAVVIAGQKLASWAQAAELAAVAQVASRAAAADKNIGVRPDGRPARVCRDATGQVSLALMMSDYGAAVWADLAVTLSWRLPATGEALAAGRIDLYRARRIAEATSVLSEQKAREVEAKVLPGAGQLTPAQLRKRLRRAVIAADPAAAERRRADAERQAGVNLYPDEDGTATLAGTGLPAIQAAAAMAKITAMARARKAAGLGGGLDLHRAQVMLGLLLGTLPPTPPPEGAPPDQPSSDSNPGGGGPGGNPGGGGPGGGPGGGGPGGGPGGGGPGSDPGNTADGGLADDVPFPGDEDAPPEDAPPEDGLGDTGAGDPGCGGYADDADDLAAAGPTEAWPALGAIPAALARPRQEPDGRPVPGLLDVTLPWITLAGLPGGGPGILGRIGPVTPVQARQLAAAAEHDPAAQWRIIVTNAAGQAIAVTRIRRQRSRAGPGPATDGPPHPTGLVGRITLTISRDTLREQAEQATGLSKQATGRAGGPGPPGGIAVAALRAAATALDQALVRAEADAAAGGCAHTDQSPGYRPPPRLREHVTARDVTCRNPVCCQPAWRADLDHTIPYEHGGRTCRCNIGGGCRRHHQLKQHPRWKLEQTRPGVFTWTTPAGRSYTVGPDSHPL
jgi:Domain of unknown function (DUF222)